MAVSHSTHTATPELVQSSFARVLHASWSMTAAMIRAVIGR